LARKAKNVGIAGATARLFNAASRNSEELATISAAKKSESEFTNFGLSDYRFLKSPSKSGGALEGAA